ncbi:hypothetical protein [Candidatus Marimicrobium litorale]|uniref:Uncharacterized protein n=1 Tax=Candidatus Marimicrobium litorale TaxID=2518991 RepID=A0ABT3T714_9GAMM|nr:hypothetical protein [Candidatus Marimicrobium litorale]MCX2978066.1 hypothetical protein [Candidatus Marimicrobium litorale]
MAIDWALLRVLLLIVVCSGSLVSLSTVWLLDVLMVPDSVKASNTGGGSGGSGGGLSDALLPPPPPPPPQAARQAQRTARMHRLVRAAREFGRGVAYCVRDTKKITGSPSGDRKPQCVK